MPKWQEGGLKECVHTETVEVGGLTAVGPQRDLVASGKSMIFSPMRMHYIEKDPHKHISINVCVCLHVCVCCLSVK